MCISLGISQLLCCYDKLVFKCIYQLWAWGFLLFFNSFVCWFCCGLVGFFLNERARFFSSKCLVLN